ncbi:MAG: hypothetical protein ACOH1H_14605 [Brevundimonas sp.]
MKVRAALRESWTSQKAGFDELSRLADNTFRQECSQRRWHYEARVKVLDSYTMKIETGRVAGVDQLEDFFGCTIVVQNSSQIAAALALVETVCDVVYRKPPLPSETHSAPSDFSFDDLRLYARLKPAPGARPSLADGLVFEIQLKTFLMHAWAIATHDLLYKSDQLSWARERIAFQVRAMLEHAEITIQQADQLATADQLAREDKETRELKALMAVLDTWPAEQLPSDRRRLSQNVRTMLRLANIPVDAFAGWLADAGDLPLNVGPYQRAVQIVLINADAEVRRYVNRRPGKKRFVIYEADRPDWISADHEGLSIGVQKGPPIGVQ